MEYIREAQRVAPASDTLVFTVTYNEARNIGELLNVLSALPIDADFLVVDDLGTDGTEDVLRRHASENPRLDFIVRPGKLGIGSAHVAAWNYARRLGYSRIVSLDADMSHDPNDISKLLAVLDAGADVAIGSRFLTESILDYSGFRLFLSQRANRSIKFLTRLPITEYTTSLRAARLSVVPFGLVETIKEDGYSFFFICMVRFARHGLRIGEIPIHFHKRLSGKSKVSNREILRSARNLVRLAFERSSKMFTPIETADLASPSRLFIRNRPLRAEGGDDVLQRNSIIRGP